MRRVVLSLTLMFLAGCGGAGSPAAPAASPTPYCDNAHVVLGTGTLVQPANGSVGVSPTGASLQITLTGTVSNPVADLNPAAGGATVTVPLSLQNGQYVATLPTLASHTAYTVAVAATVPASGACTYPFNAVVGSFTTQ